MGDYQCIHCNDSGNCRFCSWFFERDEIHRECGSRWGDHEWDGRSAYHACPKGR